MLMCNVKGLSFRADPENYRLTLQFPKALWSVFASFSSLF